MQKSWHVDQNKWIVVQNALMRTEPFVLLGISMQLPPGQATSSLAHTSDKLTPFRRGAG